MSWSNPRSENLSTSVRQIPSILRFFCVFLLATASFTVQAEPFSVQNEFPNYFLPPQYRQVPPSQVPLQVADGAVAQINLALNSIFHRLTIPVVPKGEKQPRMVRYFDYMQQELSKIDSKVEVLPSGGVVRSAIGYLYSEMLDGMAGRPPLTPEQVLKRIIEGTEDVAGHKIRGVGSDFDILLKHSGPHLFPTLQRQAAEITNSAESLYEARSFAGGIKRSLFTVGDVKDYDEQTRRSTRQGGAAVDFLAFDLAAKQVLEPVGYTGIMQDLARGWYRYLPPETEEHVEDAAKQTIRGIRPLIELPFLSLADESRLLTDFESIRKSLAEGKGPSSKAMEQFDKAVRNARFSGAHNRFHRGSNGSLEHSVSQILTELELKKERSTIPEFVDAFPVDQRTASSRDLRGLPEHLLMGMDEFIKSHTHDGKLYHGTPNVENGLAVLRGGLFISKTGGKIAGTGRTMAAFGRGGYSSPKKQTALGYAGAEGIVFELPVAQSKHLNIIDWETVKNTPEMQALQKKAADQGRDIFELLARDHGIDIIVNHHVLIQNINAVEIPKDIKSIIHAYGSVMENSHATADARILAFSMYRQLHSYAEALGEKNVRAAPSLHQFQDWLLTQSEQKATAIGALLEHSQYGAATLVDLKNDPRKLSLWQNALEEGLDSADANVRKAATRQVFNFLDPADPSNQVLWRRTVGRVSAESAELSRSLLSVLQNDYGLGRNLGEIEKYASRHSAPSQFGALALWLEKVYQDPKLPAPLRLSAHRFHALVRPLSYFSEPPASNLENLSETDFVKKVFQDSADPLSPFKMALNDYSLGEIWGGQVQDDLSVRARFRKALSVGLGSQATASDAIDLIKRFLPDTLKPDLDLHRRSVMASIKLFQEPEIKRLDDFYGDPKVIDRIFFSNDAKFNAFLPAVEHLLRSPYSLNLRTQILTQLLERNADLLAKHPEWEHKLPGLILGLPVTATDYKTRTPLANKPFFAALRQYSPDLWAKMVEKTVAGDHHDIDWDGSDPVQRKALLDLLKRHDSKELAALWDELELRYPKLARNIPYGHWESKEISAAVQKIPDVDIKGRLLRAVKEAHVAHQAAYAYDTLIRSADEKTQGEIVRDWFATDPPTGFNKIFIHIIISSPNMSRDFIHRLEKSQRPESSALTLEFLGEFEDLNAAIEKSAAWKQKLRSYLLNFPDPNWVNYPFDFHSAEDQVLIKKYFDGSFSFKTARERDLHEEARKQFATSVRTLDIPDSLRTIVDRKFTPTAAEYEAPWQLLKKEVEELTETERAELHRFLDQPISKTENFLSSALKAEDGLYSLAVDRLKRFSSNDSAFAFLDLMADLEHSRGYMASRVWKSLAADDTFMHSLNSALRSEVPSNPELLEKIWVYPWSADRVLDWEAATVVASTYPDVSDELFRTLSELERKYGSLISYYNKDKLHEIRLDEIKKSIVTSPSDWERLVRLLESSKRYFRVNQLLFKLAGQGSIEFKRHFPNHPAALLPQPTSSYFRNDLARVFNDRPEVNGLLSRIHQGAMNKADEGLVQHFFKRRDANFFLTLVLNGEGSTEEAMKWLSRKSARGMLLKIMAPADKSEAAKVQDAVNQRPHLRNQLLADLRKTPTVDKVMSFPWNLEKPSEVRLLLSFRPSHWSEGSRDFLDHLLKRQPGAFSRIFASDKTLTERVNHAQQLENPSWKVVNQYAEKGMESLTAQEQGSIQKLLSRPLHLGTAHAITEMLESPSGLELVVARLQRPMPLDQPIGIFTVLKKLQKTSNPRFELLKKQIDWKRLRDELFEEPAGATSAQRAYWVEHAAGVYPWVPADPEDVKLMQTLSVVDPIENERVIGATELQLKARRLNPQVRSNLEVKRREALHHRYIHRAIGDALAQIAIGDPKLFAEKFPHLPLPLIEIKSYDKSEIRLSSADSVASLFKKVADGMPLSPGELQVKQWYLQKQDLGLLAWMLARPSTREEGLKILTEKEPSLALRLLTTEGPTWFSRYEFLEELVKNSDWLDRVVPLVEKSDFPISLWQRLLSALRGSHPALRAVIHRKMATYHGRGPEKVDQFWDRIGKNFEIEEPKQGVIMSTSDIPVQHRDAYQKLPLFNPNASDARPRKDLVDCGKALAKLVQRKYWFLPEISD